MNKTIHTLFTFMLLGGFACAQGVVFEKTVHDFGVLKQRQKASYEFVFSNKGSETVYLLPPRPGCGCTAALLSESTLPPGKSGKLSVEFSAYAGMVGAVEKNVHVVRKVRDTEEQLATLTIKATVVGEIVPDTGLLRFDVVEGDSAVVRVMLKSASDKSLLLDNVSAAIMEYLDTTAGVQYHADKVIARPVADVSLKLSRERLNPGESAELSIGMRTHGKGQMNGSVRIVLPESEVRLPVVGIVRRRSVDAQRE